MTQAIATTSQRFLWVIGEHLEELALTGLVKDRFRVISPRIWLDTKPELPPEFPDRLDQVRPYLLLHPYQLHLPQVYGVCRITETTEVLLLENVPIAPYGDLYPALNHEWGKVSGVRQLYWLWQMLELWTPMAELGVTASWFIPANVRVEGWRVRLISLESGHKATLADLGNLWQNWLAAAQPEIQAELGAIITLMQQEQTPLLQISHQLNQLLLQQAAQLPLRLRVAGATDAGPQQLHNEDNCYPQGSNDGDPVQPFLSIVCDGVGGHEGGEVASQLTVATLKLQVRALLKEITEDPQVMPPELVAEQLQEIVRVVNNMIANRNDEQQREARRRMGTTLLMALQLPQPVDTPQGKRNGHELYLVNVGDSRAYWITPHYCHQLTVDDDVATREARLGRCLYRQATQRKDAMALTQAIGTKQADALNPRIQRFILEEDGLLLLCSDGLSDNGCVEEVWRELIQEVLQGKIDLEQAVAKLLTIAASKNGHDNISAVLTYCSVAQEHSVLVGPILNLPQTADSFLFPASAQLLYDDSEPSIPKAKQKKLDWRLAAIALLGCLTLGLALWWILAPVNLQQQWQRIFPTRQ